MNLPTIRIKSSFLLNDKVTPLLVPGLVEAGREHMATPEFITEKVGEYNEAWATHGEVILRAMCDVLGLEFRQNIIDAYVAPFSNSFSDPMIISPKYTAIRFVDVFTHELTHRLLTDNTSFDPLQHGRLADHWRELFGNNHSFVTLVHIPVHAMLAYILTDILHAPERLLNDKAICQNFDAYRVAWEYVDAHDYREILAQLKQLYAHF